MENTHINPPQTGLERTFYWMLGASILAHIVFLSLEKMEFTPPRDLLYEEWSVEADLLVDTNLSFPKSSAIPDAKKAEEARVPDNMLPQLSKKFAIEKKQSKQEEFVEEVVQKKKDEVKGKELKNEKGEVNVKSDPKEANRLKMQDALKRLAMEKLRKDNKVAKRVEAEKSDPLARLQSELANSKIAAGSEGVGANAAARKHYRGRLKSHIGRYWTVPEAYNLKDANLLVTIAVVINERGFTSSIKIKRSSGDSAFDDMALNAVKNAVPLPKPPKGSAGEEIHLNFTPKSF